MNWHSLSFFLFLLVGVSYLSCSPPACSSTSECGGLFACLFVVGSCALRSPCRGGSRLSFGCLAQHSHCSGSRLEYVCWFFFIYINNNKIK